MTRYCVQPVWSKIDETMSKQILLIREKAQLASKIDSITVCISDMAPRPNMIHSLPHYSFTQNKILDIKFSLGPSSYAGSELPGLRYGNENLILNQPLPRRRML